MHTSKPITYTSDADKLTITVTGAAFANLKKIADTMNTVDWCDDDNTPEGIFRFWLGDFMDRIGDDKDVKEITSDICYAIDTDYDDDTPEDKERKAKLRDAFEAVGL